MTALPGDQRRVEWDRGSGQVWALSGALHHLRLELDDGRTVMPLAEAPWHSDGATTGDASIAAHLRFLGGEWPCVPFGRTADDPVIHGFGTDNCWRFEMAADGVALSIDYPEDRPVTRLRRTVAGVPGKAEVRFTLEVTARRDCVLPVGLHPILSCGMAGEAPVIDAQFGHGETFPVVFEPGVSRLAAGANFQDTEALPLAGGGTVPFGALLRETTEEAFQLFATGGSVRVIYPLSNHAVRISWNDDDFPTCLFWMSTGGRTGKPWRGRFRGFGVEPLHARFENQGGQGVICGGRRFRAGETWTTTYSIAVGEI